MGPGKMVTRALQLLWLATCFEYCTADYKIGVGIADCTGPIAGVVFVSISYMPTFIIKNFSNQKRIIFIYTRKRIQNIHLLMYYRNNTTKNVLIL